MRTSSAACSRSRGSTPSSEATTWCPLQGGSLAFVDITTSVWVLDDDAGRYARAVEIADEYAARRQEPAETEGGAVWRCRSCGETVEEQFTACWSCGAERGRQS